MKEKIAVREAQRLGIPVFGIVDTNSNPNGIDFVIPANDDASQSIQLITSVMVEAIREGLQERKLDKDKDDEDDDSEVEEEPRRGRRTRKSVVKQEVAPVEEEEAEEEVSDEDIEEEADIEEEDVESEDDVEEVEE